MPIKVNSLEQTAETQISRHKLPINHYTVFHQISKTKPFYKLSQNADCSKLSRTDCRNSNIQTKIADKPLCCVPPNNNKQNPFINFFKCRLK